MENDIVSCTNNDSVWINDIIYHNYYDDYYNYYDNYYKYYKCCNEEYIDKEKICKVLKIESKIKDEALISLIETIFKECERLEAIENKKIQNSYENVFNEGAKSVKDKLNNLLNKYANVKIDNSAKIIEFYQKLKELSKGEE